MSKTNIVVSRTPLSTPSSESTKKSQTSVRLGQDYDALAIQKEFDRVHESINQILVEDAPLADLPTDGSASNASICKQINSLAATLRKAGLLRSS